MTVDTTEALLPDTILTTYQLTKPTGSVIVRGTARRLNLYDKRWMYGTLEGVDSAISFRCPADKSPLKDGETVILKGYLEVSPSKIHDGLMVRLNGERIGDWVKTYESVRPIVPKRDTVKISLKQFIKDTSQFQQHLLIVGTERGLNDYRSAFRDGEIAWHEQCVGVLNTDDFLADINAAIAQFSPKALVIVRGGADSQKTMRVWDDAEVINFLLSTNCRIYTAIGHSDGFVGLDKFADETFDTPNGFGHRFRQTLIDLIDEKKRANDYADALKRNELLLVDLKNARAKHGADLTQLEYSQTTQIRKLQKQRTALIIVATLLAVFAIGVVVVVLGPR